MNAAAKRAQLNREAVLSASPARLVTMLYDRLMLDLSRAETAQHDQRWAEAGTELVHAQAILAELSSSLRPDVWDGAEALQSLYGFATTNLVEANTQRNAVKTRAVIELLEPLRQTWHEASMAEAAATPVATGSVQSDGGFVGVG